MHESHVHSLQGIRNNLFDLENHRLKSAGSNGRGICDRSQEGKFSEQAKHNNEFGL